MKAITKIILNLLLIFSLTANAKENKDGVSNIRITSNSSIPAFIQFEKGKEPLVKEIKQWLVDNYKMDVKFDFILLNKETDQLGFVHYKYQQTYYNIPIETTRLILHTKQEKVESLNGLLFDVLPTNGTSASQSEKSALSSALKHINATTYKWQNKKEELALKESTKNPLATYYPKGTLVYTFGKNKNNKPNAYLAYKFDVYATKPLYRAYIYVDALTNQVINEESRIHYNDIQSTAFTVYSGTQTITANYVTLNTYQLRETGRGNGIETNNIQNGSYSDYGNAVDFIDADNIWNNINPQGDQYATDAHWGAEMTYDYYFTKHNRNSIDNAGFKIKSYIHFETNYTNAFWDGSVMTYGDGDASLGETPYVCADIVGHEITHGLTEHTAGLLYAGESGGLNEAFSDIFGQSIEFFAKPSSASWLLGSEAGVVFRDMSNPNAYNQPDTYHGVDWDFATEEVHNTSGVANYWYYLLVTGGTGTNDNGDNYAVTGIGLENAAKIAFRCLTIYLTPSSNYADTRFYSIQAAIDIFGPCSPEVIATGNAWYAVGVGSVYPNTVQSVFSTQTQSLCAAPQNVLFNNASNNGINYLWYFGDGTTSTNVSPSHTYNSNGTYSVALVTFGGTCGKDSVTKINYINISPSNPCSYNIGEASTYLSCDGVLYDDGGSSNNYSNSLDGFNKQYVQSTIQGAAGNTLSIQFNEFEMEEGYDSLYIYDGIGTNAALLGAFSGTLLPYGGALTNMNTNAITLVQVSDYALNYKGYKIKWDCNTNVGIKEAKKESNELTILPNPTTNYVTLNYFSESTNAINVKLIDAIGKELMETQINKTTNNAYQTSLNLSRYTNGIYYISIIDGVKQTIKKIILNN